MTVLESVKVDDFAQQYADTQKLMADSERSLDGLLARLERKRDLFKKRLAVKLDALHFGEFDEEDVHSFVGEPYAILPREGRENEWWVITPKFTGYQLGYLHHVSKGWNYFLVNKYMGWLARIPEELRSKFKFRKPLPLKVFDGVLLTGEDYQDEAWARYRRYLSRRRGKDRVLVKKGKEFELIAQIINDGMLPFIPQPVEKEDLKPYPNVDFKLRDYQEEAWQRFLELGALGVYWPFGAGKTYLGMQAVASLKGSKLIVVPGKTLRFQWEDRIRKFVYDPGDWRVETYHSYHKLKGEEFSLIIFDECHRLPANTFSRMATLKAKYRIGLSGTPYREDGRTDYIFALTGYPLGADWQRFFAEEIVKKPDVTLYLFRDGWGKQRKLDELMEDLSLKTIVFVWKIDIGKRLSQKYEIPFVYGQTLEKERMKIIGSSQQTVVSSVGSEGISVEDLDRVVEYDWLGKSRREEAQRLGRLFHSKEASVEHIILMTEKEYMRDEQRLYAIFDKGIRVNVIH